MPLSKKTADLIDHCEERLDEVLPQLYSKTDLQRVRKILMPKFRKRFTELFSRLESTHGIEIGQFFAQSRGDLLCRSIDQMFAKYRNDLRLCDEKPFDEKLNGTPLYDGILEIRQHIREGLSRDLKLSYESSVMGENVNGNNPEARCLEVRTILFQKKIIDRRDLYWTRGVHFFLQEDFGAHGKGQQFLTMALGRPIRKLTLAHLKELADLCDFPEIGEANQKLMKRALANRKIISHRSLMTMGPVAFKSSSFPPFGTGNALYSFYRGENITSVTRECLAELADFLKLPEVAVQDKNAWRGALKAHGIQDRPSLLAKGVVAFNSLRFNGIGKGKAFISHVLGFTAESVTTELLNQIADVLALPPLCQESCMQLRTAFESQGVFSLSDLEAGGLKGFSTMEFGSFGTGKNLFSYTHQMSWREVRMEEILALGRQVGLPEISTAKVRETQLSAYRDSLMAVGIRTKNDLLMMGPKTFSFCPLPSSERGLDLAGKVLGKNLRCLHYNNLHEVARVLELEEDTDMSRAFVRRLLQDHGITDQRTLLRRGPSWFRSQAFDPFGKGRALLAFVFGGNSMVITEDTLQQLAFWLGLEVFSEDSKQKARHILAKNGIHSLRDMRVMGVQTFGSLQFEELGGAEAFLAYVSGTPSQDVSIAAFEKTAEILGLPADISDQLPVGRWKDELAAYGVRTRWDLLKIGLVPFSKLPIGQHSSGLRWMSEVLGRSISIPCLRNLCDVADLLGLETAEDEMRADLRQVLEQKGIHYDHQLLAFGASAFVRENFGIFGSGRMIVTLIFGKPVDSISCKTLAEVGDFLQLEKNEDAKKTCIRAALKEHGVDSREVLMQKGVKWMMSASFGDIGGGFSLFSYALGSSQGRLTVAHLEALSDYCELPQESLNKIPELTRILERLGIRSKRSIHFISCHALLKKDFSPYSGFYTFAGRFLDRTIPMISTEVLYELAAKAELPEISQEEYDQAHSQLKEKGVFSAEDLFDRGIVWFNKETFGSFGKGAQMVSFFTGKRLKRVSREDLMSFCRLIGYAPDEKNLPTTRCKKTFPAINESRIREFEEVLRELNFETREAFETFSIRALHDLEFGHFKGLNHFASNVLGHSVSRVTRPVIRQMAFVIFGDD